MEFGEAQILPSLMAIKCDCIKPSSHSYYRVRETEATVDTHNILSRNQFDISFCNIMSKQYLAVPEVCDEEKLGSRRGSFARDTIVHSMTDNIREALPLSEDQVKEALEESISNKWCISLKGDPLKKLDLNEITTQSIFRYELESLVETRVISKKIEIYDGKPIDGRENGIVPDAWDAPVMPPGNFIEQETTFLMPHSEEVHLCSSCEGETKVYCSKCRGHGRRRLSGQIVLNPDEKPTYLEKP